MEVMQEYWLQREMKGGEWKDIIKSLEYRSLIGAGMIRYRERGDICRVVDTSTGEIIWHAKGALTDEDAPNNG